MALSSVYDGPATNWEADAGPVYRPLGRHLVTRSPIALQDQRVLDAGCGSGAAALAAQARGAVVVGIDRSLPMARHCAARSLPALVGDLLHLPCADRTFDVAMAAFVISHLSPADALAELLRVVRPGGAVLATAWGRVAEDPHKAAVEEVLRRHGWAAPMWFQSLQQQFEPVSGDPRRLAEAAREAGLSEVDVTMDFPELGLIDPTAFVAYRLTMPHVAEWLNALSPSARRAVVDQAVEAIGASVEWHPGVVVLTGRRPSTQSGGSRLRQ
jgi:SAM-dependent methyltransferase